MSAENGVVAAVELSSSSTNVIAAKGLRFDGGVVVADKSKFGVGDVLAAVASRFAGDVLAADDLNFEEEVIAADGSSGLSTNIIAAGDPANVQQQMDRDSQWAKKWIECVIDQSYCSKWFEFRR